MYLHPVANGAEMALKIMKTPSAKVHLTSMPTYTNAITSALGQAIHNILSTMFVLLNVSLLIIISCYFHVMMFH